jgi:hypothetical protein
MLPFILGVFPLLIPFTGSGKITAGRLTFLGLLIILLVYIDWYIIFLSFIFSILVLFKTGKTQVFICIL